MIVMMLLVVLSTYSNGRNGVRAVIIDISKVISPIKRNVKLFVIGSILGDLYCVYVCVRRS